MTTLEPEAFEEIFLKLEEESERRALAAVPSPDRAQQRQRSRGSISISRFGHIEDDIQQQTNFGSSRMSTPTFVHGMTTFAPFYGVQSHVGGYASPEPVRWADRGFVAQNPSADSLSAESIFGDDAGLSAENDHVTQVHRIAGRQSLHRSVGDILQRTLTRSWTNGDLCSNGLDTSVVVGVVVEENHREEPEPREGQPRRSMVYAPSTPRPQATRRATIPGAEKRGTSWRSRAGELFRRKARPSRSTLWSVTPSES